MKTEFKLGDNVVYPMHGVGVIDRIEEKSILGNKQLYYVLKLSLSDMTSMTPVDKSQKLGVRACTLSNGIEEAFQLLIEITEDVEKDWTSRTNHNLNLVTSEVISTYVYKVAMASGTSDFSYATAIGMFNSVINLLMLAMANAMSRRFSQASLW